MRKKAGKGSAACGLEVNVSHLRMILGSSLALAIAVFSVAEGARQLGVGEPDPLLSSSAATSPDATEGTAGSADTIAAVRGDSRNRLAGTLDPAGDSQIVDPADNTALLPPD